MTRSRAQLLSSRTAANEAIHREINTWFSNTPMLHQSTLYLKTRVLQIAKLMTHNSALYRPTTSQLSQDMLLARALGHTSLWNADTWATWCAELNMGSSIGKAALPLASSRRTLVEKRRLWVKTRVMKRPSVTKKPASSIKRHAFNLVRRSALVSSGRKGVFKPT